MGFLLAMIVQALVGVGAAFGVAHLLKVTGLPRLTLVLAGALGGIGGGTVLGVMFGVGSVETTLTASTILRIVQVAAQIVGAAAGGGALTAVIARVIKI